MLAESWALWACPECPKQVPIPFTTVLDPFSDGLTVNGLVSVDPTPFREHVAAHGHYLPDPAS